MTDRGLFFEYRNRPTHKEWPDAHADLELRIRDIIDRIRGAVKVLAGVDPVTVSHRVVKASTAGDAVVINFRMAQTYLLYMDATKPVIVVPPSIPVGRAGAWTLEIEQGVGAPFSVSSWSGCEFYGDVPVAADFSTVAGYVDVVAFRYAGFDTTLRGMFRAGCPS